MLTTRLTSATMASVAMLVLAGCDDGGSAAEETADGESPLAEYMGKNAVAFHAGGLTFSFGGGVGVETYEPTEEELRRQREFEESVASCMAEQGFEYVPNVVNPDKITSPFEEAYSLPPDEFAKQYGYGVSTLRFEEAELPEDPNQEIRESLSPEAREAYDKALFGDVRGTVADGRGEATPPPIEERGCYGQASSEVYDIDEQGMFGPRSEFDALMEDLFRLGRRIQDDPRVVEATEKWRGCMAGAGYPDFEQVGDAQESVFQRMAKLQVVGAPPAEAPVPADEAGEDADGEDGESTGPRIIDTREIDPVALEELQVYELAVAQADFDCREEHYNDVVQEVRYELEEEFVEEHRAELERYRDEMARLRGDGAVDNESDD